MKNEFRIHVGAIWLLLFVSCGPAHPLSPPEQGPSVQVPHQAGTNEFSVADLGVEIFRVHSSAFHKRAHGAPVSQDWTSGYLDFSSYGVTYFQHEASYSRIFYLFDPTSSDPMKQEEVFFVWSDQFLGQTVLSVMVDHRVLDGNNQWIGDFNPIVVWHDLERKKWVLPISRLFQDSQAIYQTHVHESDTQQINLRLTLSDSKQVLITLKLRAAGPLPKY